MAVEAEERKLTTYPYPYVQDGHSFEQLTRFSPTEIAGDRRLRLGVPLPEVHEWYRPCISSIVLDSSKICRSVDNDAPLLIADSIMEDISTSSSKRLRVVQ